MTQVPLNACKDDNLKSSAALSTSRPTGFSRSLETAAGELKNIVQDPAATSKIGRKGGDYPALLDRMMKVRLGRAEFFPTGLFSDPAWEILLNLFAAEFAQHRISVTSLGLAADVPSTTAQRWLNALAEKGMVRRYQDPLDARRIYIELHPDTSLALKNYFAFVEELSVA